MASRTKIYKVRKKLTRNAMAKKRKNYDAIHGTTLSKSELFGDNK